MCHFQPSNQQMNDCQKERENPLMILSSFLISLWARTDLKEDQCCTLLNFNLSCNLQQGTNIFLVCPEQGGTGSQCASQSSTPGPTLMLKQSIVVQDAPQLDLSHMQRTYQAKIAPTICMDGRVTFLSFHLVARRPTLSFFTFYCL